MRDKKEFCIAMDIGGTSVRSVPYCLESERALQSIQKHCFQKNGNVEQEVTDNIFCYIDEYIILYGEAYRLRYISISLAAQFNRETGEIIAWPNHQRWNGLKLKEKLKKRYEVEVLLEDDANCGALGECWKGEGNLLKSFVYITVSTGIGCGIILDRKIYLGNNGWAGEIGHIKIAESERKCVCGKNGCLQAIASGPAIVSGYNSQTGSAYETLEELHLMHQNENIYNQCFAEAAMGLVRTIGAINALLDIDDFIIGGGVIEVDEMRCAIKNNISPCIKIYYTKLKGINCLIGAIWKCLQMYKSNEV